jgi:methyltransferase family protein
MNRPKTCADFSWPVILPFVGNPRSAIDFGCGNGHWLAALKDIVPSVEVLGVNSPEREDAGIYLHPDEYNHADLTKPMKLNRTFDLAICVELAEHLPPSAADTLIDSITSHSDAVLFSGAIPGQDDPSFGLHLNEQWPDYWIKRFAAHGFLCFDRIRPLIWQDPNIALWYRQNIMLFMRRPKVPLIDGVDWDGASVAHPWYYQNARRHRRTVTNLVRFIRGRDMF